MSMQQLEIAGWHSVPRTESWLRRGCAPVCCVLENRRKGRHLGLCSAIAGAVLGNTMLVLQLFRVAITGKDNCCPPCTGIEGRTAHGLGCILVVPPPEWAGAGGSREDEALYLLLLLLQGKW